MNDLKLPNPKMMDVAVPANMRVGLSQERDRRARAGLCRRRRRWRRSPRDVVLIDLREKSEREKHGLIPGSLHAPYTDLAENISAGGMLHELADATGRRLVFYCAYGERSAMAVEAAQDAGLDRLPRRGRRRRLEKGRRTARALISGQATSNSAPRSPSSPKAKAAGAGPAASACACCGEDISKRQTNAAN